MADPSAGSSDVNTTSATVDSDRVPDGQHAEVLRLRRELWVARDAVIAAEAAAATLRVRNRHLEVRCGQLDATLAAQTRLSRLVGRLTGNRYVSTAIMRAKAFGSTRA